MADRQRLIEIVEKILTSEWRETADDSASLDYAQDMLDEWLNAHIAEAAEQIAQAIEKQAARYSGEEFDYRSGLTYAARIARQHGEEVAGDG